jgi:hypothetical protein
VRWWKPLPVAAANGIERFDQIDRMMLVEALAQHTADALLELLIRRSLKHFGYITTRQAMAAVLEDNRQAYSVDGRPA